MLRVITSLIGLTFFAVAGAIAAPEVGGAAHNAFGLDDEKMQES